MQSGLAWTRFGHLGILERSSVWLVVWRPCGDAGSMTTEDYISPETVALARGSFAEALVPRLSVEDLALLIELERRGSVDRRSVARGDYDRRQS